MMKSPNMLLATTLLLGCLILSICLTTTTAATQDGAITAPFAFNPSGTAYTNLSPRLTLNVDAPLACDPTCQVTVKIGPDVRWDPALPLLFMPSSAGTMWDSTFKQRVEVTRDRSVQPKAGAFNTHTGEITWDVEWPSLIADPDTQSDPKVEHRKLGFKLAGTSFPNSITIQSLILKDPQGTTYELSTPWSHSRAPPISETFEVKYDYLPNPTTFQKDYRTLSLKLTDLKMPLFNTISLINNSSIPIFKQFDLGTTTPCQVIGKDGTKLTTAQVTLSNLDTVMKLVPNTPLATGLDITISCSAWGIDTRGESFGKKRWAYILENQSNMISTEAPLPPFPKSDDDDGFNTGIGGLIAFIIVILAIAGGAFYYFKVYKPKQQGGAQDAPLLRSDGEYDIA